jgi:hypothetical protein
MAHIAELAILNNRAKIDSENNTSLGIPAVIVGKRLQVKSGDSILAKCEYVEE